MRARDEEVLRMRMQLEDAQRDVQRAQVTRHLERRDEAPLEEMRSALTGALSRACAALPQNRRRLVLRSVPCVLLLLWRRAPAPPWRAAEAVGERSSHFWQPILEQVCLRCTRPQIAAFLRLEPHLRVAFNYWPPSKLAVRKA